MNIDDKVLKLLVSDAKKAAKKGEIPVSAVILDKDNNVVSHAFNKRQSGFNVLGHAEILAILKAEKRIKDWRLDGYKMVVVLEPCDMCSMVISKCRIDEIYYFIAQKNQDDLDDFGINKHFIKKYDQYRDFFEKLLVNFFYNMR